MKALFLFVLAVVLVIVLLPFIIVALKIFFIVGIALTVIYLVWAVLLTVFGEKSS